VLYVAALRTQIYLTAEQRARLDELARRQSKALAEFIRDAVDAYLTEADPEVERRLTATFGAAPNLKVPSRSEWDRGYG
jgi:metal-responsive CopG/Arc/MetJ family transcriptional regulator